MPARLISTLIALIFAIGAFCGAGPTTVSPSPFGFLFVGIAVLVWFAWKPMTAGFDRPGIWDAITRGWTGWRNDKRESQSHS
jgi:hypothetical protein